MQNDDLAKLVEDALDELKAKDVVRIDVKELTSVTDFMIIASGTSGRHVNSLADNVVEKSKEAGRRPLGVEGQDSGEWILVDLGDVVVHIMQPATRQFYDLERLWQSAESRRAQQQQQMPEEE
jgi:ribosome-associated protein